MKIRYHKIIFFGFSTLFLIGCKREKAPEVSSLKDGRSTALQASPQISTLQAAPVIAPQFNENNKRPSQRGPKQKHPQIIASPSKPNPIADRLLQELSGLQPNSKAYIERLRILWKENSQRISDSPLESADDEAIAKGVILPVEMNHLEKPDSTRDTPEASLLFLAFLASGQDNLITEFIKERANVLPPKRSDILIYQALNAVVREFTQMRGQSSYVSFEAWEPFAKAANPIYRLLALEAAPVAVSKTAWEVDIDSKEFNRINDQPKMGFYLSYLDEKDPVILTTAIRSLATVPLPEARQAIEKFHAQQLQSGDNVLIQVAEEALRTQKLISP